MEIITTNIENVSGHSIQRNLTTSKVKNIVENYDPRLVGILTAVQYGDKYLVIDGNHRLTAMKELGHKEVVLNVVDTELDQRESYQLFLMCNDNRRPVSALEGFQVGLIAEDDEALYLESLLSEFGFEAGNKGDTLSVPAMIAAIEKGVERDVLIALDILRETGNETIYSNAVIRGITRFRTGAPPLDWNKFFESVNMDGIVLDVGSGQVANKIAWALVGLLPSYVTV